MKEESNSSDYHKLLTEQLNQAEKAALQDLRSMTLKQVQQDNYKLRQKIKNEDIQLYRLLAQVSELAVPQLAGLIRPEKDKHLTRQLKKPNKGQHEKKLLDYYMKSKHSDLCDKYLPKIKAIQLDNITIMTSLKKLMKIILDKTPHIHNLSIYYSTEYPMLLFSYEQEKQKYFKHLRQIIKDVYPLRYKAKMFDDIFCQYFERVDNKYHNLVTFALQRVKSTGFKVTQNDLLEQTEKHPIMFYYNLSEEKYLNFVIFDKDLKCYEFDSSFINKHKNKHQEEYLSFESLFCYVYGQNYNEEVNDIFDNEEAESEDEDRPRLEKRSLDSIREDVQNYMNKDLSQLEQTIEKLADKVQDEAKIDSSSDKMYRLTEQLELLEQNRVNYQNVRDEVRKSIQIGYKNSYLIALKKLLLANKQLESKLPIIGKKRQILGLLQKKQLIIIEGETGSGKSTQFPQILCEYYKMLDNPDAKPVLVTQPRRLATRSLAERVAKQMGEYVGDFVDYVASVGKTANKNAKIIFKLDRIVLDQLTQDPLLSNYSCLVIDQAHERTISIDVILGMIKQLLGKRDDFKVIVTSASMDIHLFESYFRTKTLRISGRLHPVQIIYKDYANIQEDKLMTVRKVQKLITEEILDSNNAMKFQYKGHLLCFCSSVEQISQLVKIFESKLDQKLFTVLPLHGKITPSDQKRVFEATGKHKFIFASRIAETAITIDKVKVVIDPGKDIQMVYDQKYKITSMKVVDISQSSAKQRAGRAGRTAPGYCFRLYSEQNFKNRNVSKIPEMENSSLQNVVLRLKSLKVQKIISFPFLSKPSEEGLVSSINLLKAIGALDKKTEIITKIGRLLVKIPMNPFLSRAIIEGIFFEKILNDDKYKQLKKDIPHIQLQKIQKRGLVKSITVILSLLINFSSLFFIRPMDRQSGEAVKHQNFSDQDGDFFFLDNIYQKYLQLKQQSQSTLRNGNNVLKAWLMENYLNPKILLQAEDLIDEISKISSLFTIQEYNFKNEIARAYSHLEKCKSYRQAILSCLITSFSLSLCKYSNNPHIGYTIVNQKRPVQIYGTSNLSLLGIKADWIISYDLYTNQLGRLYCKVAHKVSYDFIITHTDPDLQEMLKIKEIQQNMPFYEQMDFSLPTATLVKIRSEFNRGLRNAQFQFLRQANPAINQDKNQISFFILIDNQDTPNYAKSSNSRPTKQLKSKIRSYVDSNKKMVKEQYRHNYIGNVHVSFQDGFNLKNIDFERKQFTVEVVSIERIIDYILGACNQFEKRQVYLVTNDDKVLDKFKQLNKQQYCFKKIIFYVSDHEKKQTLTSYLDELKKYYQYEFLVIYYTVNIRDSLKKIPRTKVSLRFYAGKSKLGNIFMRYYYSKQQINDNKAQKVLIFLKNLLHKVIQTQAFKKLSDQNNNQYLKARRMNILEEGMPKIIIWKVYKFKLTPQKIQMSKNNTGINVIEKSCDQQELRDFMSYLNKIYFKKQNLSLPISFQAFRQPQFQSASKSNEQWTSKIKSLLKQQNISTDDLVIKVQGLYRRNNKDEKLTQYQKSLRVDLNAQIFGLSKAQIKKLLKIDGTLGKLGCEKLHVRVNYDQTIAIAEKNQFEALQQEFEQAIMLFKEKYAHLQFQIIYRRQRNRCIKIIKAYSPNRDDFVEPQRIISNLFSPRIVDLTGQQYNILDKMQKGRNILKKLQEYFNYRVHFEFQRYRKTLKVYCCETDFQNLKQLLATDLNSIDIYSERMSYRGKNLNRVKQILDNEVYMSGNRIKYDIIYQKRQILLWANYDQFEGIKNGILKLQNSDKEQCKICMCTLKTPYKLINCECVFCWQCIASSIRQFVQSNQFAYLCPSQQCRKQKKSVVSIYDFKTLLSEEQFQRLCDIKVKKFINQSQQTRAKLCNFCDNILDKQETKEDGFLDCQLCGKSWCIQCGEDHKGYSCEQWKKHKPDIKQMKRMQIKRCPKCHSGIEKNGGCNHVTCVECNAHICWMCFKYFFTQQKYSDHLGKQCGGIFDPNAQEWQQI